MQQRHALHFSNHLVPEIEAGVCPLACDDITHLNTINIIEYHWGSNSKGTKKFLNWHWIDLFQIDSSIQGSLKINILLPGPTPQSLVLSPQAPEAEKRKKRKKTAIDGCHDLVLNENIIKVLLTWSRANILKRWLPRGMACRLSVNGLSMRIINKK